MIIWTLAGYFVINDENIDKVRLFHLKEKYIPLLER